MEDCEMFGNNSNSICFKSSAFFKPFTEKSIRFDKMDGCLNYGKITKNKNPLFIQNENHINNVDKKRIRYNKVKHSFVGCIHFLDEHKNKTIKLKLFQDNILSNLNTSLLIESVKDEDVFSDDEVISNSQEFLLKELGKAIELYKERNNMLKE
jgi:hypothetical protein